MTEKWRNAKKTASEVLPLLTPGKKLCVFDTETTGLPRKEKTVKIIQFSAIRFCISEGYKFEEIDFLDLYINPEEPLDKKITELTGITDQMLEKAATENEVWSGIFSYLESADVWAAYNARFDLTMLDGMEDRVNGFLSRRPTVDVLDFSRDWLKKGVDVENNKLQTTYHALYPDGNINFHRAIEDVTATACVMEALLPKYQDLLTEEHSPKKEISLEKVYGWINPHNPRQQRICLKLTDGNTVSNGDIYYDAVELYWSHKANTYAKKLFHSLDLSDIEKRVLEMSSNRYETYQSMEQLARSRMSWLRKQKRQ